MRIPRPSIFTRYIAKSLITFFCGVVGILMFVIFMNQFIRIMNMAMTYGTSWAWILSSLLNVMPDVFTMAAPMAFQIAILLVYLFLIFYPGKLLNKNDKTTNV